MEKRMNLLVVVTLLSLLLNAIVLQQLAGQLDQIEVLKQQIHHTTSNLNMVHRSLTDAISRMNSTQAEPPWITSTNFSGDNERSTQEQFLVNAEVGFRELASNARVFLLYQEIGAADWQRVEARKTTGATYAAQMRLEPYKEYQYQFEAVGASTRTSDILRLPAYNFPAPLFISSWGHGGSGRRITDVSISFRQRSPILFDFYRVADVRAFLKKADGTLEPVQLDVQGYNEKEWTLGVRDLGDKSIAIVEVEYGDGTIVQEEIDLMDPWPYKEREEERRLFWPRDN